MGFTLEDTYGLSRDQYCIITGITKGELVKHLEAEILVLNDNLDRQRHSYRIGGSYASDGQRRKAELIKVIEDKINRKRAKIKDIKESK